MGEGTRGGGAGGGRDAPGPAEIVAERWGDLGIGSLRIGVASFMEAELMDGGEALRKGAPLESVGKLG